MDEKQPSWIATHVHMYEYKYFGVVAKILVPDNCRTAVDHNNSWKDQRIQERAPVRDGSQSSKHTKKELADCCQLLVADVKICKQ